MSEEEKQEEKKTLIKNAMKEWLNERFDEFATKVGKWVIRVVVSALFLSVIYWMLKINGWYKLPTGQ